MNDDNHKTLQEFAMGEIIKGLRAERDALKAELEEKNTELKKWKYVPGVMHCAKCNFQLIKSVLNMHRGTVTAGDSNPELCPNGCGPLWRVSWEKYANDHYEDGVKTFEKLRATEAELEAARKQEPCGYMCEEAGMTTVYNAAKCTGDFSKYTPVYKYPFSSQQDTGHRLALIMKIVKQIVSAYHQLRSHELWESIQKAEQLLKGGENER